MDAENYLRAILSLVFVVGLIGLVSVIFKKYLLEKVSIVGKSKEKRIFVEEFSVVDAKHRLVLVRKDDKEHLILLGATSDLLIESVAITKKTSF